MRHKLMTLKGALDEIRRVHPAAAPNSAFIHQVNWNVCVCILRQARQCVSV